LTKHKEASFKKKSAVHLATLLIKKSREQVNLFLLALSFFTRIPTPKIMQYSEVLLNKANRYFSLVGLILGLMLALSYTCLNTLLPINVSILLMMGLSMLLTGAFHEDGLADMADGIGGAFTREKRLSIMKDSRIGTYGAVTLIMSLMLKFMLLNELAKGDSNHLLLAIVLAESLSRAIAGSLISTMPYVGDIELSKSKPLAQAQSSKELCLLLLIGIAPLALYSGEIIFSLLLVLLLFRWIFKQWLMAKIGGFTGDCLGAGQQLSQLLIFLVLISFSSNASVSSNIISGTLG